MKFTNPIGIPHWIPKSLLKYFSSHSTIGSQESKKANNTLYLYDLNKNIITTSSCGTKGVFAQENYNPKELEDLFTKIEANYGILLKELDNTLLNNERTQEEILYSLLFENNQNLLIFIEYSLMNYLRNKKMFTHFNNYCQNFEKKDFIYNIYWSIVYEIIFNKEILGIIIEKIKNFDIESLSILYGKNKILLLPDLPIMLFDSEGFLLNIINLYIKNSVNEISLSKINFYLLPNLFMLLENERPVDSEYIANSFFREAICCSENYLIISKNINTSGLYTQEMPLMNKQRIRQNFIFDFQKKELNKFI